MFKSIIFTLFVIVSMYGNTLYASDNQQLTKSPVQFVSKDGDYSIQIPSNWEMIKDQMGTDVIALAPLLDPQDLFRENLNIISAKFDFPITKEEYYSLNLKSLSELLTAFDLEDSQDVNLGGVEARKIIFTHTVGIVSVRVIQYLILSGEKAIVISFTSDTIEYPKIKDQFAEIASSFKFQKT